MLLREFVKVNGIPKITIMQGKGRKFADVSIDGDIQRLFFSQDVDLKKELYINEGVHEALWIGNNQGAKEVGEISF